MIGKYPKCYNRYIIHNKIENVIDKHKSNKIKENSNTVRHLNNGTDHRHSKSCCDQSSPARRTINTSICNMNFAVKKIVKLRNNKSPMAEIFS